METLSLDFYRRSAEVVAEELLGRHLVRRLRGQELVLRIVETEAYLGVVDRASHAWGGRRTERNRILFEAGGKAYVYLVYGIHHCLNAVTGEIGDGSAVLIRAGEPLAGAGTMRSLRGLERAPRPGQLAGGPGKLCQALDVDRRFNGQSLSRGQLRIAPGMPASPSEIVIGARVGVEYAGRAAAWPLRFALRGNAHVSRPVVR